MTARLPRSRSGGSAALRAVAPALRGAVAGLALCAASPVLAQTIPPPTGSVSPDGDYAYSGRISYDPAACSRGAGGMVYFAVGRRVLRQPMDNLGYMMGMDAADRRAIPHVKRPEEPAGCPDHPIQMFSYTLLRVSAMPGDLAGPASNDADRISALIHNGDRPARQNSFFTLVCGSGERPPDHTAAGFVGCRTPRPCDQAASYESTEYAEPNGTKVALTCEVRAPACTIEQGGVCQGGYLLREHFTVNFTFGVARLPIARFPAADQEMRRRLDAAEVKDFEWAPDAGGN